jgi:stage IV sporulation protein A
MQATGKPFLVVINSREPQATAAKQVQEELKTKYSVDAVIADCQTLDAQEIAELLQALLYAFPLGQLQIHLPRWVDALPLEHPLKAVLYDALLKSAREIDHLGQTEEALSQLRELEQVQDMTIRSIDLGDGTVNCVILLPDKLFYEILSQQTGMEIQNEAQLMSILMQLSQVKGEYDKISDALSSVKATGYGVVMPTAEEMTLEKPQMLRKNGSFGVKLKAGAPSIHMIRVDIDTEINPMVGGEQQSQDLVTYLSSEDPDKLWESNIFGKSVYELIQEGLTAKLVQLPEDVRGKFRGTLTRIVNEGATGLICLIL